MTATGSSTSRWPNAAVAAGLRRLLRRIVAVALVVGSFLLDSVAFGQAAWEYSPYQVVVWIACESNELPEARQASIARELMDRAETVHGAAWSVTASAAPAALRSQMLLHLDQLTVADIEAAANESLSSDKLLLISIKRTGGSFAIRVRELDCRTQQWSPMVDRSAGSIETIPLAAWDGLMAAFTPLARIAAVDGKAVSARVRSGGLVIDPDSPLLIRPGNVLKPIVRRNDRSGQPAPNGIQVPEWTLLRVENSQQSQLTCQLMSGFRSPIPIKAGQRTDRLALLVRPTWPQTRLVLMSRTSPARPLGGYQVFRRIDPSAEPELLGATAADGSFILPATDGSLQPLLIRSGGQVLARLPIVPGQAKELVANVIDDEGRLQAEGFVLAFQSRVMDLVARRQLLTAQFRKLLEAGKTEEAREVLEQFRDLETRTDLEAVLARQQQEITSSDRVTSLRIQKLFSDARKLLLKFLDPNTANELARELAVTRTRPPAAKPASTSGSANPGTLASPAKP